jgi:hypothetical protein
MTYARFWDETSPPELGPPQNKLLRYTAYWASQGKTSRRSITAESADEAALLFVKHSGGSLTDEATVCVEIGYGPDAGLVCRYKVSLGVYRIVPMKQETFVVPRTDLS